MILKLILVLVLVSIWHDLAKYVRLSISFQRLVSSGTGSDTGSGTGTEQCLIYLGQICLQVVLVLSLVLVQKYVSSKSFQELVLSGTGTGTDPGTSTGQYYSHDWAKYVSSISFLGLVSSGAALPHFRRCAASLYLQSLLLATFRQNL